MMSPAADCAQDVSQMRPHDLVGTDPAAFLRWLHVGRPAPITPEDKVRVLSSLPASGEVTDLNVGALTKLAGLTLVLESTQRNSVYSVKVIDVPQAAIGLHARAVLLISEAALSLLTTEELQALAAHEVGHEYVWDDYERAVGFADRNRVKELELFCDAIAIAILHRLGMDSSQLSSGIEKISSFNRQRFGTADNERNYPTVGERRLFAARIRAWLRRAELPRPALVLPNSPPGRHGIDYLLEPGIESQWGEQAVSANDLVVIQADSAGIFQPFQGLFRVVQRRVKMSHVQGHEDVHASIPID